MALPGGVSSCNMCVQMMTSTTWTDVSDHMTVVSPPTQTRMTGEAYVFGEDVAVIGVGKRQPVDVTVRGVWTGTSTEPFYNVYTEFTSPCGDLVAIRWGPDGCTTAKQVFYTNTTKSEVVSLTFPGGDAGSAEIIMYEFVLRTPEVTWAVWA
jgi:hypothetical protein